MQGRVLGSCTGWMVGRRCTPKPKSRNERQRPDSNRRQRGCQRGCGVPALYRLSYAATNLRARNCTLHDVPSRVLRGRSRCCTSLLTQRLPIPSPQARRNVPTRDWSQRQDSNLRPSGYKPDEMTASPLCIDISRSCGSSATSEAHQEGDQLRLPALCKASGCHIHPERLFQPPSS